MCSRLLKTIVFAACFANIFCDVHTAGVEETGQAAVQSTVQHSDLHAECCTGHTMRMSGLVVA